VSNLAEIDDALSNALIALHAAQAVLRKGAAPRELDVLRKLDELPRANGDAIAKRGLDALADLERRCGPRSRS
jgi:hypothetical protein